MKMNTKDESDYRTYMEWLRIVEKQVRKEIAKEQVLKAKPGELIS